MSIMDLNYNNVGINCVDTSFDKGGDKEKKV